MTTIGIATFTARIQIDTFSRPAAIDRPARPDRPDRPERPDRPDRPDHPHHGPRSKLAHLTRRFVHAAKDILQGGGSFEDVAKLARTAVAEHPALKDFPPFQKIMERIAWNLGHHPLQSPAAPAADAVAAESGADASATRTEPVSVVV